jgi:putative transcriptional regulator
MQDSLTGRLLVALPALEDPNFERAVVFILDHDEDGALGVVLNRASDVPLAEALTDWTSLAAVPEVVFGGGPVEPTAVVALGQEASDVAVPEGREVHGGEDGLGPVRLVDVSAGPPVGELVEVRIFAGYAGWAPGQLEDEIAQGAWVSVPALAEDVFTAAPDELWSRVLARQPGRLRLLAGFPEDPSVN